MTTSVGCLHLPIGCLYCVAMLSFGCLLLSIGCLNFSIGCLHLSIGCLHLSIGNGQVLVIGIRLTDLVDTKIACLGVHMTTHSGVGLGVVMYNDNVTAKLLSTRNKTNKTEKNVKLEHQC